MTFVFVSLQRLGNLVTPPQNRAPSPPDHSKDSYFVEKALSGLLQPFGAGAQSKGGGGLITFKTGIQVLLEGGYLQQNHLY